MIPSGSRALLRCLLGLGATTVACSDDAPSPGGGGSGGQSATGGGGDGARGGTPNQCGAVAPWPVDTGHCTAVSAPAVADFDDYAGSDASGYAYYVNARPPAANAVNGALLHVGDGSDANGGASVVATEMVIGEGDAGYALQFSNSNASNWGGLLMLYFPGSGAGPTCLDARSYGGVEFSVRGVSPSGKFGLNVGMLDTIPTAENGLCHKASANDCKDPSIELSLPADAATWTHVRVPWSAFTPGIAGGGTCVSTTGENVVRVVIQPFMRYPAPDYVFEPGAYAIAIDNVRFY